MKPNNYIVVKTINSIPFNLQSFNSVSPNNKPFPDVIDELGKIGLKRTNNNGSVVADSQSDMFKCMQPFLIFGKLVGVVPISGIFKGDLDQLKFKKCGVSGLICLSIITILTCNLGIAILGYLTTGGKDATHLAKNAAGSVCYGIGLYVFVFVYRNSNEFINLLKKWRAAELISVYEERDHKLSFSLNLIAGIILTSAITENAVSHLLLFPLDEVVENPLEYYYVNSHKQWSVMIPYHPVMAIAVFFCNKWALYAWNFGDILIILTSRTIYGKFKGFIEIVREQSGLHEKAGKTYLHNAILYHDKLCKLTEEFADLLSPLVFTSFVVNIYFICIQLHLFLAPTKKSHFLTSLYGSWSFLHLLARTYAVALSAAKINDYAHQFGKLLNNCSKEVYSIEIERAERRMTTYPVALHGLGTFYISRPFILSVISVIFTFEIVLLTTPQVMSEE